MKEYRSDIRARMAALGRDPDSCKILYLIGPVVAASREEAQIRVDRRRAAAEANIDARLAQMGWSTNIDFSGHDLDAPVAELTTNGHQSSLAQFVRRAGGKTLREAIIGYSTSGGVVDFVGTPDDVAAQMDEVMQEVGGDGFLFSLSDVSRKSVAEITDGLVPALQQRGLTRTCFGGKHLRDNLLEF
jgi:alkanesulfonate monooxygenase SsuD/methylene tetrahydromethanopterin reductase-like flavin-dependent oxidoreductase (luciferase family)